MIDFPQCPDCLAEYTDPQDRRFHSQTNSCWSCGPTLELRAADGRALEGDPILETIAALEAGKTVALQGIGGFHLAADPRSDAAMKRIRQDKERERKPFALMVADRREAELLCRLREGDWERLTAPASPIMIFPLAESAPPYLDRVSQTGTLGLMLPYTPLHLLLFRYPDAVFSYRHLVMTSGNLKGEPIVTTPEEAFEKLSEVADLFLYHNRRILFRSDDSVERIIRSGQRIFLRRSRGYVPRLIPLQSALTPDGAGGRGGSKKRPGSGERGGHLPGSLPRGSGGSADPPRLRESDPQDPDIVPKCSPRPWCTIFTPPTTLPVGLWSSGSSTRSGCSTTMLICWR